MTIDRFIREELTEDEKRDWLPPRSPASFLGSTPSSFGDNIEARDAQRSQITSPSPAAPSGTTTL